ncbi:zinc ribbon domain-containing protein [Demequina sp. NBRC 110057]|uniref:zinc ribbon domain-containing protein n=1 Tax=Demequina sp. NBRC 110057 TaxID=1570346 RepID=UPI000A0714A4|nr:C4-type zinc ribbon domain-containing protein [Demequina sp. NBRC 110057]
MPNAPVADQLRLLEVQDADLRLQQARHRRATLPLTEQIAELSARAADLEEDAVARGTEVSDLRREVTKAEDDVQSVRQRADRDRSRLESGTGSAKDLQALQGELEVLARRQSALEDVELEVMERLEAAEALHTEARAQRDAIAADITRFSAERDEQLAEIDSEIGDIEAERVLKAEGVDATLMALYEKLRDQHGGVGAAALRGSQCLGCHMTLNAGDLRAIESAAPDAVVRCEECGRILVRKADA